MDNRDLMHALYEERCINADTQVISNDIVRYISEDGVRTASRHRNDDGVCERRGYYIYDGNGFRLDVEFIIAYFPDRDSFERFYNEYRQDSFSICEENRIFVWGHAVGGTVDRAGLSDSVWHEVAHCVRNRLDIGSVHLLSDNNEDLYRKLYILLNSKQLDNQEHTVIDALFVSFEEEQDGFVNGFYGSLSDRSSASWALEHSEVSRVRDAYRDAINIIESDMDRFDIFLRGNIGKGSKWVLKVLKSADRRLMSKIGRVMSLFADRMASGPAILGKQKTL